MLNRRKGMTLVEIIVALAIFAIVVVAFLPTFLTIARLNIVSKSGFDLTAIAQTEAEKFYGYSRNNTFMNTMSLAEVTSAYTSPTGPTDTTVPKILSRTDNMNHVTIDITLWDGNPQVGMTKISILATIIPTFNTQNALPEQIDSILLFKK